MPIIKLAFIIALAGILKAQNPATAVFSQPFANLIAPAASAPLRNIGQSNHILIVRPHGSTAQQGGLVCRLEAATDNIIWFPITNDVVFLPQLGTPPAAYAIVKGNGVYPYLRVSCPTVPGTPGLDVSYIGSPYPYGDIVFSDDRYLTTSVGSSAAALAGPPEPTGTDGITSLGAWNRICSQEQPCDAQSLVDNGNNTLTLTQTASLINQYAPSGGGTPTTPPINLQTVPGGIGGWNKIIMKFGAWSSAALGTGGAYKGILLTDPASPTLGDGTAHYALWFAAYRNTAANGSNWTFSVGVGTGINVYLSSGGRTLLTAPSQGTTEHPQTCLSLSKAARTLTFAYSYDCITYTTLGSLTADQYAVIAPTPPMNWSQVGIIAVIDGPGATYPQSFLINRFRFY